MLKIILWFCFGAVVGSFLNVCISRLPKGESIITPSSHCPKCNHRLLPFELIPIFSFLLQRGKCRHCGETISWRYPVVEILSGAWFVFALQQNQGLPAIISLLVMGSIYLAIFFADWETSLIPDELILAGIIWSLTMAAVNHTLLNCGLGLIVGGGFLWLVRLGAGRIYRQEALGFGDVKLGALLGLDLGLPGTVLALFCSYLLGGVVALILVMVRIKRWKQAVPFGPFLIAGAFLVKLFSSQLRRLLLPWW